MTNPFQEIDSRLQNIEAVLIRLENLQSTSVLAPAPQSAPADTNYDITGLAQYLGCSIQTVHNLKKDGAIPFYKLGRNVFFKKSEIDANARVTAIGEKKKGGKKC